jgi:hypothetical protein
VSPCPKSKRKRACVFSKNHVVHLHAKNQRSPFSFQVTRLNCGVQNRNAQTEEPVATPRDAPPPLLTLPRTCASRITLSHPRAVERSEVPRETVSGARDAGAGGALTRGHA